MSFPPAVVQLALQRDSHCCFLCGSTERLQVHDLKYGLHDDPNLAVTLCFKCHHSKAHSGINHIKRACKLRLPPKFRIKVDSRPGLAYIPEQGYERAYRLRIAVTGRRSVEVTLPYEVIERKAKEQNLTVLEFVARFQAVAVFNSFDGVWCRFEPINPADKVPVELVEKA